MSQLASPVPPKEKGPLRGKFLPGDQRLADVPLGPWAHDGVAFLPHPRLPDRRMSLFLPCREGPKLKLCMLCLLRLVGAVSLFSEVDYRTS